MNATPFVNTSWSPSTTARLGLGAAPQWSRALSSMTPRMRMQCHLVGAAFEHDFDYTYDGIMRSHGLAATAVLEPRDMLTIHDCDENHFDAHKLSAQLTNLYTSGWRALDS